MALRPFPTTARRRTLPCGVLVGLVAVVTLVGLPTPAVADPSPYPYYRSEITSGALLGNGAVAVAVRYDDTLQLAWRPGTTVEVPGYAGDAYLQVRADGSVWVNRNSPATYLNVDRFALTPIPVEVSNQDPASTPPGWDPVPPCPAAPGADPALPPAPITASPPNPVGLCLPDATSVEFHDHRIHWMSPSLPPVVQNDGLVLEWRVPMVVNGLDDAVAGQLWLDLDLARIVSPDFERTTLVDDIYAPAAPPSGNKVWLVAGIAASVMLGVGLAAWLYRRSHNDGGSDPAVVAE